MGTRTTHAAVNAALRKRGVAVKLYRGRGYQYFSGDGTGSWPATAVYVDDIGALTVDEWVREYERLKAEAW